MKKRVPFRAAVAFFLTPGIGQLYNGRANKAVGVYALSLAVLFLVFFLYRHFSFAGFLTGNLILLGFALYGTYDGYREAKHVGAISLRKYNKAIVYVLVVACNGLAMVPVVRSQDLRAFHVPTGSMHPTLSVGDFVLGDMAIRSQIHRGDVVLAAFRHDKEMLFIKRIIGLPGETVEIAGKQILINGRVLEDPWGVYELDGEEGHISCDPITVPHDCYFVLGDNRDFSMDSRRWGCVERTSIQGRPLYIYWSKSLGRVGKNIR